MQRYHNALLMLEDFIPIIPNLAQTGLPYISQFIIYLYAYRISSIFEDEP